MLWDYDRFHRHHQLHHRHGGAHLKHHHGHGQETWGAVKEVDFKILDKSTGALNSFKIHRGSELLITIGDFQVDQLDRFNRIAGNQSDIFELTIRLCVRSWIISSFVTNGLNQTGQLLISKKNVAKWVGVLLVQKCKKPQIHKNTARRYWLKLTQTENAGIDSNRLKLTQIENTVIDSNYSN